MVRITISLDDWIMRDIIGEPKNVSSRIKELLIKAHYQLEQAPKDRAHQRALWDPSPQTDSIMTCPGVA